MVSVILDRVKSYSRGDSPFVIFDANGHAISLANSSTTFMHSLNQADLVHADGQSVVRFSQWIDGHEIPERTATTDTITDLPELSEHSLRHFLLGGSEETVSNCAQILNSTYHNFHIAGALHGYFDKSKSDEVIAHINASNADVLWVGFGKPIEQYWIMENKSKLRVPVIISCGGCFNYVTGDYKRAPLWMQNRGLEWAHRMLTEPKKLFWRYLTTNPHAVYCVLKHKFFGKKKYD
ncbi:WecB/TagA/CpsF family glycosyltransferase [Glaciecola sp. MH2013]|nr:WecB/TagA/CpsF family glycosyltransferase [Glaciecola sp. MH2013]